MVTLTQAQTDALTELINIAFNRTASALSELAGQRVLLETPHVEVRSIHEIQPLLQEVMPGEVATVHQVFTGPVAGDALLLLSYEGAVTLTELLTETPTRDSHLDASAREVLVEVGNILLNACLGMFGNALSVHISFSVPRLRLEDVGALLDSLLIDEEELRYALIAYTSFHVQDSAISGYLVIVLGVASLDGLLRGVEHMG